MVSSFPQFARFPGEIQDMVWEYAAARSPQVHFLQRLEPNFETWMDSDALLIPDQQSGALNLVNLSRACRAANAAVHRRNQAVEKKTIFRILSFESRLGKTMNLILDLRTDLVCFGGADAGPQEINDALGWGDYSHIIFTGARHFAVRYHEGLQPDDDDTIFKPENHEKGILAGIPFRSCSRGGKGHLTFDSAEQPFCPRSVRSVLRRFHKLESFYLIVDRRGVPEKTHMNSLGHRQDVSTTDAVPGTNPIFESYSRAYFEPVDMNKEDELRGPMNALKCIKRRLTKPRAGIVSPRWAENLKVGLLAWRESTFTLPVIE
ncbi:hypothetical protein B0H63DRAFT_83888 [Podospora didyma]|uniref:2EXR domain-containing protein n=1 Tax=Podospora didyma TaxID=330526 RepID=A0AAE0N295_9PEZI|nr:hypothetical protein B0H63DRAFT_83888 [Podospora didyma]